ncbi:hypothetical protein R1flu_012834 [Riccia fluitans]|uniref:N-lysine methyltransferase n=1 Tax=Riccia fluitans TaxID=41844 RepID=A0ABD1ZF43_9MARC
MVKYSRVVVAAKPATSVLARKFRTFLRWMRVNGIEYSDGLAFELGGSGSVADIGVKALVDMKEGNLIATIPKQACLTMLTTEASSVLEEAELGGGLGLVVAVMFERSLQERSKWYGYLQLLPDAQTLPFLWTPEEIDELLCGTELHQVIKEDRVLMEEDWKESIAPLTERSPEKFPAEWFSLDQYLAAKTLVNSRAFEVDEYYGYGMVPLADLFNHKTADEDVHFTNVSSDSEDDSLELDVEEPSLPPSALSNGRKRYNHAESKEDQEVGHTTKSMRKESRSRQVNGGGKFPEVERVRTHRRKCTPLAEDEDIINVPNNLEKRKTRQKMEVHENAVESELECKDRVGNRSNGKRKGKHQKEMKVKPVKDQYIDPKPLGEQFDFVRKSATGEKPKKSEGNLKSVGHERKHQMKEEENGARSQKQRQTQKPRTQLPQRVEESTSEPDEVERGQSEILEMILVKNVAAGAEVFNTYGTLSNAALLHRYGFTELANPFDIVNVDLSLVVDTFGGAHTPRRVRRRVSKWKEVSFSPLESQESEYFEISATGKPEEGLLMLLYILNLSDEKFDSLSYMPDSLDCENKIVTTASFLGWGDPPEERPAAKSSRKRRKGRNKKLENQEKAEVDLETWLLTAPVCRSMLEVLRSRDSLYPTDSVEADETMLSATHSTTQPERFHALRLRISERLILRKCKTRVSRQLAKSRKSS